MKTLKNGSLPKKKPRLKLRLHGADISILIDYFFLLPFFFLSTVGILDNAGRSRIIVCSFSIILNLLCCGITVLDVILGQLSLSS